MKIKAPWLVSVAALALVACQPDKTARPGDAPVPAKPEVPRTMPDATQPGTFMGVSLKVAQDAADRAGVKHRVIMEDGVSKPATMDYNPARLNFTVEKGIVTAVNKG